MKPINTNQYDFPDERFNATDLDLESYDPAGFEYTRLQIAGETGEIHLHLIDTTEIIDYRFAVDGSIKFGFEYMIRYPESGHIQNLSLTTGVTFGIDKIELTIQSENNELLWADADTLNINALSASLLQSAKRIPRHVSTILIPKIGSNQLKIPTITPLNDDQKTMYLVIDLSNMSDQIQVIDSMQKMAKMLLTNQLKG